MTTDMTPFSPRPQENEPLWTDAFLSPAKCRSVLEELEFAFWRPSTVVRRGNAGELHSSTSEARVSESTSEEWFSTPLKREIRQLERRIARQLSCSPTRFESWQATRYGPGDGFDYHLDCGYWTQEARGERWMTVLLYLDTPEQGGATHFKHLDVEVKAQAGRVLMWRNLLANGQCNSQMLHASMPLVRGQKTTLVTWIRERGSPSTPASGVTRHEEDI